MQGGFEDFGQKVDLTQRIREVLQVCLVMAGLLDI